LRLNSGDGRIRQTDDMRKKIVTVLAWLVATAASMALATSAVSSVRDEVTDQPAPLVSTVNTTAAIALAPSTMITQPAVTVPTTGGGTTEPTTTVASSSSTATPSSDSTATTSSITSTTSSVTTQPPATTKPPRATTTTTTTTTAAPKGEYFKSYQLVGGWVRLRIAGNEVFLQGRVPSAGYSMDVEKDGPVEVDVEFTNGRHKSSLKARVDHGELVVHTDEEDDD